MYLSLVKLFIFKFIFTNYLCLSFIHNRISRYTKKIQNTHLMKTCFPDDEESMKKKVRDLILENWGLHNNSFEYESNNPIYTLLWYDCEECNELLENMVKLQLSTNYINGDNNLFDFSKVDFTEIKPLLYKDSEFVGDNLFDIYEEIYNN